MSDPLRYTGSYARRRRQKAEREWLAAKQEKDCPRCEGSGEIKWLRNPPDPQTEDYAECPDCRGRGEKPSR